MANFPEALAQALASLRRKEPAQLVQEGANQWSFVPQGSATVAPDNLGLWTVEKKGGLVRIIQENAAPETLDRIEHTPHIDYFCRRDLNSYLGTPTGEFFRWLETRIHEGIYLTAIATAYDIRDPRVPKREWAFSYSSSTPHEESHAVFSLQEGTRRKSVDVLREMGEVQKKRLVAERNEKQIMRVLTKILTDAKQDAALIDDVLKFKKYPSTLAFTVAKELWRSYSVGQYPALIPKTREIDPLCCYFSLSLVHGNMLWLLTESLPGAVQDLRTVRARIPLSETQMGQTEQPRYIVCQAEDNKVPEETVRAFIEFNAKDAQTSALEQALKILHGEKEDKI